MREPLLDDRLSPGGLCDYAMEKEAIIGALGKTFGKITSKASAAISRLFGSGPSITRGQMLRTPMSSAAKKRVSQSLGGAVKKIPMSPGSGAGRSPKDIASQLWVHRRGSAPRVKGQTISGLESGAKGLKSAPVLSAEGAAAKMKGRPQPMTISQTKKPPASSQTKKPPAPSADEAVESASAGGKPVKSESPGAGTKKKKKKPDAGDEGVSPLAAGLGGGLIGVGGTMALSGDEPELKVLKVGSLNLFAHPGVLTENLRRKRGGLVRAKPKEK